jgi:flavin-binding protein dodecin
MAVARVTTLTASSADSFDDATRQALDRANKTLRNVTGAEVTSQKVKVDQGRIHEFRVTLDVTFILDD